MGRKSLYYLIARDRDTNDFSANKDCWAQFEAAGLTPIHNGESSTCTDEELSIDNMFISSHITCLYYNVINSRQWMYGTSSQVPVSDHDFVYADLQFDFETVIAAKRANS